MVGRRTFTEHSDRITGNQVHRFGVVAHNLDGDLAEIVRRRPRRRVFRAHLPDGPRVDRRVKGGDATVGTTGGPTGTAGGASAAAGRGGVFGVVGGAVVVVVADGDFEFEAGVLQARSGPEFRPLGLISYLSVCVFEISSFDVT